MNLATETRSELEFGAPDSRDNLLRDHDFSCRKISAPAFSTRADFSFREQESNAASRRRRPPKKKALALSPGRSPDTGPAIFRFPAGSCPCEDGNRAPGPARVCPPRNILISVE